ncbi:STAS domain-containing protein [bacterium]|nr:STAS domain-containing protein [bacterium]
MELNFQTLNNIEKARLIVKLSGKINMENAADIEKTIKSNLDNVKELLLDFSEVSYVASVGLRVLLELQKTITAKNAAMYIKNVNDEVKNVFEITGFQNILNII